MNRRRRGRKSQVEAKPASHSVAVVEERLFGQKQNQLWDQQLVVATVSGSNNGSSKISPAVCERIKTKPIVEATGSASTTTVATVS